MEFVENLNKDEFDNFVKNHQKGHFLQSFHWGEVSKEKKYKPHFVGIKQDGEIIATALLLEKHLIKKYCFFYCPRGFVCDFSDFELLKFFTDSLKKYCKKNHGIFLRLDPDIKLQDLDENGNVIESENDNHELVNYMVKLGYTHKGFNKNFENNEPRYTFRLNINKEIDEVRKVFHPTIRQIINRGNIYQLEIYKGTADDLKVFYDTMIDTAKREYLVLSPIEYYENFYNILNKQNMSDIYVAKINIDNLKNNYKNKIELLHQEIDLASMKDDKKNAKKIEIKLKELNMSLEKNINELEELNNIKEKEIVLSSIITAKYKNKVWTIHGGNKNELRHLNANYWIYYTIMENAINEGYQIFDFFGTTGDQDPKNPVAGIHLFKKRFGGEYIEFIGEFDYILNPIIYFGYTKIFPKIRKLIKK
jgi:Uncharacterized protein involved in methicillin resistance